MRGRDFIKVICDAAAYEGAGPQRLLKVIPHQQYKQKSCPYELLAGQLSADRIKRPGFSLAESGTRKSARTLSKLRADVNLWQCEASQPTHDVCCTAGVRSWHYLGRCAGMSAITESLGGLADQCASGSVPPLMTDPKRTFPTKSAAMAQLAPLRMAWESAYSSIIMPIGSSIVPREKAVYRLLPHGAWPARKEHRRVRGGLHRAVDDLAALRGRGRFGRGHFRPGLPLGS
jgi:hypothetical protein